MDGQGAGMRQGFDDGTSRGGPHQHTDGAADDGYFVPPPTPARRSPDYPGGQGWQDISGAHGGPTGGVIPPPPERKRGVGATLLRLAAVAAVLFGGSIWAYATSANRGDDGAISRAGGLDVLSLQVGDCFDDPDEEVVSTIRALPCDRPHDNEVFFTFDLPAGSALPTDEVIDEHVGRRCLPAFDDYVGVAYETSELDLFTLSPTEEGWRGGDRSVICALYDLSRDKLVGSARGIAR